VHVLSELHRDLLLGISSRHIDVIPNGVDTAAKQKPLECRKRRVIFGGEVGNRKGADVLLAAWQQLSPAGWTLVLCGPVTSDYEEVSRRAERDGIEVAGPLPPSKFRQLLSCSRVAVLPSRAEALPMFLLEAMAAGCAIVATDVGDVARLLEGGAGVVVAPGDVDALVGAFRAVLFDDAAQAVMSRMSLQRVGERYSRESIARQWGALYEDVRRASAEP
jgi:glycosyltransferase involved in cell wall biosynthesis